MHASLRHLLLAIAALAALGAFARASDDDEDVAVDAEALAAAFLEAEGDARADAYARLDGRLDPKRIDALLVERAGRAVRALGKGSAMGQLERLAKVRKELDAARARFNKNNGEFRAKGRDDKAGKARARPKVEPWIGVLLGECFTWNIFQQLRAIRKMPEP